LENRKDDEDAEKKQQMATNLDSMKLISVKVQKRKQLINEKIRQRSSQNQSKEKGQSRSYGNVVMEYDFNIDTSIINMIIDKMLIRKRKLKPQVKKKKELSYVNFDHSNINVHVIKGRNIPLRKSALENMKNEQMGGNRGMMN
jgi:hypothetical protein